MEQNWITKSIDKVVEDPRSFFWDACVALRINGITGGYVHYAGVSVAVEHADRVTVK